MATPFQCPCGRALIADDAHRGRQVKCPACGRMLVVPGAPGATAQAVGPPAAPPPATAATCRHCGAALPPGAQTCPACGAFLDAATVPAPQPPPIPGMVPFQTIEVAARNGLPWDQRASLGWLQAGWQTVIQVVMHPATAFRNMRQDDDLTNPITYYAIWFLGPGMTLFALGGGVLLLLWGSIGSQVMAAVSQAVPNFPSWQVTTGILAIVYAIGLVAIPLMNLATLFLMSGIFHLTLKLCGGAKRSFATTLSAVAYTTASTNLVQYALCCVMAVPYVGNCVSIVYTVWSFAWIVIALVNAHETDTWRALVAVFGPFAACCGCGAGLMALGVLSQLGGAM